MKLYILSLGCAKNRVDSEVLAGTLKNAGIEIVEDVEDAEAAVVNTCGFIEPAVKESISAILDLEEMKVSGKLKKIGVVGCMVNRYGQELINNCPAVDFWAQSEDWAKVLRSLELPAVDTRYRTNISSSTPWTRYLKISEGCSNRCTYCAIPLIRGDLRSLPPDTIIKEANQLVEDGAKELCLVGQDLTVYGMDRGGKSRFIELLDELEKSLPDGIWLRLLYLHPDRITRELLERVAEGKKILNYLDIPAQHGSEEILRAMNRKVGGKALSEIVSCAREIDPDFALRTTCMVGFPGEKQKHFKELLSFLSDVRFDRVGAFTYFPEEGTPAASFPDQVTKATKERRLAKLMALQEEISFERQHLFVGKTLDVIVENVNLEEGFAEGRSFREAPEVDGTVEIRAIDKKTAAGDIIKVRMTEAMVHDMIGEQVK